MTPVYHDPFRDTLEGLVCGGALVLQDASALVGIVISIMQLILDGVIFRLGSGAIHS